MTRALLSSGELATAHAEKLQENSCPPRRCDSAGIGGEMGSLSPVAPAQAVTLTEDQKQALLQISTAVSYFSAIASRYGKMSVAGEHILAEAHKNISRLTGASTPAQH